ncbi:hypothetical protein ACJJTC_013916 [Scirpophaga incertulas]
MLSFASKNRASPLNVTTEWGRRKTQPAVVGPARGRLVATTFPPESGVKQLAVFHLCAGIPEPLGDGRRDPRHGLASGRPQLVGGPNSAPATRKKLPRQLAKNPGIAPPCQLATGWEDPVAISGGLGRPRSLQVSSSPPGFARATYLVKAAPRHPTVIQPTLHT